jgi:cytochrome c553
MITNIKRVAAAMTLLIATAVFAQPAIADGDAVAGKELGYSCQRSHGIDGYRDGSRKGPVMAAQAALIAEEDVAVLAKYYASLDGLETTEPE